MEEEKTSLSSVLVSHTVCAGFSLTPAGMVFAHLSRRILMMIHRVCISFAVPVNSGNSKCIQLNVCLKTFFFFLPHFLGEKYNFIFRTALHRSWWGILHHGSSEKRGLL